MGWGGSWAIAGRPGSESLDCSRVRGFPSTIIDPGRSIECRIITPIQIQHAICVEISYSVYGQYADGKAMRPRGSGELRQLRITQGIILPSVSYLNSACGALRPFIYPIPHPRPFDMLCHILHIPECDYISADVCSV